MARAPSRPRTRKLPTSYYRFTPQGKNWHNASKVTTTAKKKKAPFPIEFYRSAVGKKFVMAITGLGILGFAIAHMIGNLKMFLPDLEEGPDIDVYGEALRSLLTPILPEHVFLWILRTGLIVMFALHVHAAYSLTAMNARARSEDYEGPRNYLVANYASRTMRWSGTIFLAFLGFHLADFTLGIRPAAPEAWERGHVFANFIETFNRPLVALFYAVAVVLLGIHLYHGVWSAFQSIGANHPRFNVWRKYLALGISGLIVVGFLAPVVATVLGVFG